MDRSEVITLIKETKTQDSLLQWVSSETTRDVFCKITSISSSEWYDGFRNGLSPEYRAIINRNEYEGETIAKLNGVRYSIYRTFIGKGENLELYLEKQVGTE